MKSILIFDTPTRCFDCPLYTSISYEDGSADEYGFCDDRNILNQKEAQEKIRFDAKPEWCPLKPLPTDMTGAYANSFAEDYVSFTEGWDSYEKELMGEDNG